MPIFPQAGTIDDFADVNEKFTRIVNDCVTMMRSQSGKCIPVDRIRWESTWSLLLRGDMDGWNVWGSLVYFIAIGKNSTIASTRQRISYLICIPFDFAATTVDIDANGKALEAKPAASDPIQNAMGQFGKWHFIVCAVVFLLKFPVAWHQMSIIFIAPPVGNFSCVNASIDRCSKDCPEYAYNRSIFTETITTQWDLVCENSQMANASQMIFMFGILIGNILFGTLADK